MNQIGEITLYQCCSTVGWVIKRHPSDEKPASIITKGSVTFNGPGPTPKVN